MKNKKKLTKKNILVLVVIVLLIFGLVILIVKDNKKTKIMECTITNEVENFANITFITNFVYDEYVKEQNMKYIYEIANDSLKSKISDLAKQLDNSFREKLANLDFPYNVTYDDNNIYISVDINYDKINVENAKNFSLFPIENLDSLKQTTIDEVVTSIEDGGGICVEK